MPYQERSIYTTKYFIILFLFLLLCVEMKVLYNNYMSVCVWVGVCVCVYTHVCEAQIHVQKHHVMSSGKLSPTAGFQCFIRKREQE